MSKVKLIIFDLDGVLVDTKETHFTTLNSALGEVDSKFTISWSEHLSKYDGLKTNQKLEMLTQEKGLPVEVYSRVWTRKQELTLEELANVQPSMELTECLKKLHQEGYLIACCSNSIRKTVNTILSKLDIIQYFDLILSNEDVKNSKPHPELYWKAMAYLNTLPEQTLIIEDSPPGLLAAQRSNANILRVESSKDLSYLYVLNKIETLKKKVMKGPKWKDSKLNVLIPMAGAGSRFEQAGYTFPKPLIEVNKKPMIQVVVENLNIDANYVYVVQKAHREKYNLDTLLNMITPGCKVVETEGVTEGAACTALLASDYIDNDAPLFFANSDQYVDWSSADFIYKMNETGADGGIVTFKAIHPKWSFAKVNQYTGLVEEVAEKNPISDDATVGYYYWKHGKDFVKYARQMIEKNIRVNNEFYVCPVFNQAIEDGKEIRTYQAEQMWGLGTPEDLKVFLSEKL